MNLNNLNIITSHILESNVRLGVNNCVFNGSVMFLMQMHYYKYYYHPILFTNVLASEVFYSYIYWTPYFQKGFLDSPIVPSTCYIYFDV